MKLMMYTKQPDQAAGRLKPVLDSLAQEEESKTFSSINRLKNDLLKPVNGSTILVIIASDVEELSDFCKMKNLLRKVKLILVLPDRKAETLELGYKLEPRFLIYRDSCLATIYAVVQKMLHRWSGGDNIRNGKTIIFENYLTERGAS